MNTMFKKLTVLSSLCILLFVQGSAHAKKTIKLLTVGNSFAQNATQYLPDIVKSVPGCELLLGKANIGGGPLDKHYKFAIESETDSNVKPYWYRKPNSKEKNHKASLKEILLSEKWDIITMQQYSAYSFKREKFIPHFDNLYAYIKKYAPQTAIMIHQTWAYRTDEGRFRSKKFSQAEMYKLLTENYMFFAEKHRCKVLPSGAAFQLCRQKQQTKFSFPDPDYDYKNPNKDIFPKQNGSLNTGWKWKKGKFVLDAHHANNRGCYLAGCVWFEILFDIDARKIKFTPKSLDRKDAAFLRAIAHETAAEFKQAKGVK
jgi:Domain of unknown function (DUF4886)